jgi:hypothetical protein
VLIDIAPSFAKGESEHSTELYEDRRSKLGKKKPRLETGAKYFGESDNAGNGSPARA